MTKYPVYEVSMLSDVRLGLHKVTTYYSDGSYEERLAPLSAPVIVEPLWGIN